MDNLDESIKKLEPLDRIILDNLREIQETHFFGADFSAYDKYLKARVKFSQVDMAMVQAAFFASVVTFPHMYGLSKVPR